MDACCKIEEQIKQKKQVLYWVLAINSVMFFAQFAAALAAQSTSLLADSLDMLGDAIVYGLSIYVATRGARWMAGAAFFKGSIIAVFGLGIFIEASYKLTEGYMPQASLMAVFGLVGLLANALCLYLLTYHRNSDLNMRSTWICARNDIVGNVSVIVAAGLVFLLGSAWPDIIIGFSLAGFLLFSAINIMRSSYRELRTA